MSPISDFNPSPGEKLNLDPVFNPSFNRDDPMAAQAELRKGQELAMQRDFSADELSFMVEVTRILRKTNTGPAKPRTSKAAAKPKIDLKTLLDF